MVIALLGVATFALFIGLGYALWRLLALKSDLARFSGVADLEQHARSLAQQNEATQRAITEQTHAAQAQHEAIQRTRTQQHEAAEREKQTVERELARIRVELQAVEEAADMQSFGFYKPQYGFESASRYESELETTRANQKALIKSERAAQCDQDWQVEGSRAKGKKMVKEQIKLMLRAFNGESDAAISKVKYSNMANLKKRIERSFEAINKLGKTKGIYITTPYLKLRLAELALVHEHREKVQEEKEEQRRIKDQMREEQKAQKEIEKVQAVAAKEEVRHQKALEKARAELAESTGKQHDKLEALVNKLQNELSEAIDRKAKAIARAQLTKSGHVYVLSNIGSFGDGVYKIGMTRRLEPLERVKELGDASVPFTFDVHAMIYTEDAPGLEKILHREFTGRRVNMVNMRKEYFRVTLEEIRQAVGKHFGIVTFLTVPKADDYRKTVALLSDQAQPRRA